eukprot:1547004-Pleurochrysis_carterae.AAC.3
MPPPPRSSRAPASQNAVSAMAHRARAEVHRALARQSGCAQCHLLFEQPEPLLHLASAGRAHRVAVLVGLGLHLDVEAVVVVLLALGALHLAHLVHADDDLDGSFLAAADPQLPRARQLPPQPSPACTTDRQ